MLDVDLDYMWTIHREKVQNKIYKENVGVC